MPELQQTDREKIDALLKEVKPAIVGHGGDLTFVKFEKNVLYIRLTGACISCAFSSYTVKYGIEEKVKTIFPAARVELV